MSSLFQTLPAMTVMSSSNCHFSSAAASPCWCTVGTLVRFVPLWSAGLGDNSGHPAWTGLAESGFHSGASRNLPGPTHDSHRLLSPHSPTLFPWVIFSSRCQPWCSARWADFPINKLQFWSCYMIFFFFWSRPWRQQRAPGPKKKFAMQLKMCLFFPTVLFWCIIQRLLLEQSGATCLERLHSLN